MRPPYEVYLFIKAGTDIGPREFVEFWDSLTESEQKQCRWEAGA